ncbi:hypothetical protein DAPPUDRAFT_314483 [Daphnia pulex]|uniref:Uncharacterized protein n=1 Tax=Daphnia pulex TaxID=6669 RepID=E9G6A8_DAPPU|nr:hypothetical protein DAPPUDRAFT_314483 [Daphnia pulex]|eukprot:EFX84902.1 hypothetical protein DAPPUDRAFT_314483 [Daphnia pulex]
MYFVFQLLNKLLTAYSSGKFTILAEFCFSLKAVYFNPEFPEEFTNLVKYHVSSITEESSLTSCVVPVLTFRFLNMKSNVLSSKSTRSLTPLFANPMAATLESPYLAPYTVPLDLRVILRY